MNIDSECAGIHINFGLLFKYSFCTFDYDSYVQWRNAYFVTDWLVLFFSYIFRLSLELVGESASRQIDRLLLAMYNSTYPMKNCRSTYWKQCSSYFSHLQFVGIWGLRQKKKESCSPNLRLDYLVLIILSFSMIPLHFWRVTVLMAALLLLQDSIPPNPNYWNWIVHILCINSYKNISNASIT